MSSHSLASPLCAAVLAAHADSKPFNHASRAAVVAAVVTMSVGVLVLFGWALDIKVLKSVVPGLATMKANAALAFALAGLALWLLQSAPANVMLRAVMRTCAAAVACIGLLTLTQYVTALDFGFDMLLFRERATAATPFAGRMAPVSALNFLLLGASMLLLSLPRPAHWPGQALALVALALSAIATIGYAFSAEHLYHQIETTTAMAVHTALTFAVLSIGILAANPDAAFMKVIANPSPGRILFYRLWIPGTAILLLLGWLTLEGRRAGLFTLEMGTAMMIVASIMLFSALIWRTGSQLNQFDAERERNRVDMQELNRTLAQRVADRTTELTESNRELEAFAYSVSHDLRAPLRAIDGFSGIVFEEYAAALVPEAQGYLERIRANARKMGCLIDDLLAFSRLGRQIVRSEQIDTSALVRECLDTLRTTHAERDVEIALGDLPDCRGDPIMLSQVWMNLIDNAYKFTAKHGNARIEIGGRVENGESTYTVCDNGAGFDMRYADKLFNVFQRLHGETEFPGTGVGLATVQRVVQRHGGRVWAAAEPGRGATFHFTLKGEAHDRQAN